MTDCCSSLSPMPFGCCGGLFIQMRLVWNQRRNRQRQLYGRQLRQLHCEIQKLEDELALVSKKLKLKRKKEKRRREMEMEMQRERELTEIAQWGQWVEAMLQKLDTETARTGQRHKSRKGQQRLRKVETGSELKCLMEQVTRNDAEILSCNQQMDGVDREEPDQRWRDGWLALQSELAELRRTLTSMERQQEQRLREEAAEQREEEKLKRELQELKDRLTQRDRQGERARLQEQEDRSTCEDGALEKAGSGLEPQREREQLQERKRKEEEERKLKELKQTLRKMQAEVEREKKETRERETALLQEMEKERKEMQRQITEEKKKAAKERETVLLQETERKREEERKEMERQIAEEKDKAAKVRETALLQEMERKQMERQISEEKEQRRLEEERMERERAEEVEKAVRERRMAFLELRRKLKEQKKEKERERRREEEQKGMEEEKERERVRQRELERERAEKERAEEREREETEQRETVARERRMALFKELRKVEEDRREKERKREVEEEKKRMEEERKKMERQRAEEERERRVAEEQEKAAKEREMLALQEMQLEEERREMEREERELHLQAGLALQNSTSIRGVKKEEDVLIDLELEEEQEEQEELPEQSWTSTGVQRLDPSPEPEPLPPVPEAETQPTTENKVVELESCTDQQIETLRESQAEAKPSTGSDFKPGVDVDNPKQFVLWPSPAGQMVKCCLQRKVVGFTSLYFMFLELNKGRQQLLCAARPVKNGQKPAYDISLDARFAPENSLGQLRFKNKTDFDLFSADESLLKAFNNHGLENLTILKTKQPVFIKETGRKGLFGGWLKKASEKSLQLVASDKSDKVVMEFGSVEKDTYSLQYSAPMCALQAFAISLSVFNKA